MMQNDEPLLEYWPVIIQPLWTTIHYYYPIVFLDLRSRNPRKSQLFPTKSIPRGFHPENNEHDFKLWHPCIIIYHVYIYMYKYIYVSVGITMTWLSKFGNESSLQHHSSTGIVNTNPAESNEIPAGAYREKVFQVPSSAHVEDFITTYPPVN